MATIVNTPAASREDISGSLVSLVVGVLIVMVIAAFLFYVGLPLLWGVNTTSAPQVTVPDKINVDVSTP